MSEDAVPARELIGADHATVLEPALRLEDLKLATVLAALRPGRTAVRVGNDDDPARRTFMLVRPADLAAFEVTVDGMRLEGAELVAPDGDENSRLVVRLASQHVAEAAVPDGSPAGSLPPLAARAAWPSRLVFAVPPRTRIPYTSNGVLEALSRLELVVAPLASPRETKLPLPRGGRPLGALTSDLALFDSGGALVIGALSAGHDHRDPVAALAERRAVTSRLNRETAVDLRTTADRGGGALGGLRLAGGLSAIFDPIRVMPTRVGMPRRPTDQETAIEAPWRLSLSPSHLNGWTHALLPTAAPGDLSRVELWHSRLGVRRVDPEDGSVRIDERSDPQKIVRAIWTRELEAKADDPYPGDDVPFLSSLTGKRRMSLVRQSAQRSSRPKLVPQPVSARSLMLSSLGAWLDLDGRWETAPYNKLKPGLTPIQVWKHVAPMGRDQYVRVEEPGYLYPFGHRAVLVTVTERKIKEAKQPQARLYQRKFIVVSEPVKHYEQHDLPFSEVRIDPLVSPDILSPAKIGLPGAPEAESLFWPTVQSGPVRWILHVRDRDENPLSFQAPLLFVSASFSDGGVVEQAYTKEPGLDRIDGRGQQLAYARPSRPGDTLNETATLRFRADLPAKKAPVPHMREAELIVPAVRHLTGSAVPVAVRYPDFFAAAGFDGGNPGEVFLELATKQIVDFASSERSGGIVRPNLGFAGLSRLTGIVGDIETVRKQEFDPQKFLQGALPKLFGMVPLSEILEAGEKLAAAPKFLTETLDRVSRLIADLQQLQTAIKGLGPTLAADAGEVGAALEELGNMVATITAPKDIEALLAAAKSKLEALKTRVAAIGAKAAGEAAKLGPAPRAEVERLAATIGALLDKPTELLEDIAAIVQLLNPAALELRAHMDWRPKLKSWPASNPTFVVDNSSSFVISLDVRASATTNPSVDLLAQLDNFKLDLFPGAPLMRFNFDRIAFRGGSNRKPDVDLVFGGIEFLGVLSFINVLRTLIPDDGFSDPPYLDVSAEGVTAGFSIALPNLAVGVFSLTNLSLGADARIPFLGDSPVNVGFNFCTRERPFTIAVAFMGGGGFFGLRAGPKRLELLELALEFGAVLALDFGVASGSVSAMGGIYLRLEGEEGSLTGYLRIRGQVDVLSLISASIELYMALAYETGTGKMVGQASITVSVEVLFFSTSVRIHTERRFAGSNGDPTVAQMLEVDASGSSVVWDDYWQAFASGGTA
jgi:hypothetical protein